LIGRTDIEDALKRLDKLTRQEAWMGIAQNLKATHTVDERVKGVADTVVTIDNRVAGVDDRVAGVSDQVASVRGQVAGVDDRVQQMADEVQRLSSNLISANY
jgi:archaellum component FlaC